MVLLGGMRRQWERAVSYAFEMNEWRRAVDVNVTGAINCAR